MSGGILGPILLSWILVCVVGLAFSYVFRTDILFAKTSTFPVARLSILPYLVLYQAVWHIKRFLMDEPLFDRVDDRIYIGRRLYPHELPDFITQVVDLTVEFRPLSYESSGVTTHFFPMLDASYPNPGSLISFIDGIDFENNVTLIHCAAGHQRSALFCALALTRMGRFRTPREALSHIQKIRPRVKITAKQARILESSSFDTRVHDS